jgi:hypothetical protein
VRAVAARLMKKHGADKVFDKKDAMRFVVEVLK